MYIITTVLSISWRITSPHFSPLTLSVVWALLITFIWNCFSSFWSVFNCPLRTCEAKTVPVLDVVFHFLYCISLLFFPFSWDLKNCLWTWNLTIWDFVSWPWWRGHQGHQWHCVSSCVIPYWWCGLSMKYSVVCISISFSRPGLFLRVLQSVQIPQAYGKVNITTEQFRISVILYRYKFCWCRSLLSCSRHNVWFGAINRYN